MSRNVVIVVVLILVAVGGWLLTRPKQTIAPTEVTQTTQTSTSTESANQPATSGAMVEEKNLVTISSSVFSPKSITIKIGESVTWVNEDSQNHTVNSTPHPTHTDYPSLNLGVIQPGKQKSLTFDKAGIYKYHDHLNPSLAGSVTVE